METLVSFLKCGLPFFTFNIVKVEDIEYLNILLIIIKLESGQMY